MAGGDGHVIALGLATRIPSVGADPPLLAHVLHAVTSSAPNKAERLPQLVGFDLDISPVGPQSRHARMRSKVMRRLGNGWCVSATEP